MVVVKIEEPKQLESNQAIGLRRIKGRVCLYDPRLECTTPVLHLKICRSCPRAAQYVRQNVVRSVFERVKALAIIILNSMNNQLSR